MERRKPKIGDRIICNSFFIKALWGRTGIITDIEIGVVSSKRFLCTIKLDKDFRRRTPQILNKTIFLYDNEFELIGNPYTQLMLFEV